MVNIGSINISNENKTQHTKTDLLLILYPNNPAIENTAIHILRHRNEVGNLI